MAQQELTAQREDIGRALGRIANGVFVVTTEKDGERHGMLASWVSQAAFEPPAVTVAFNKSRPMLEGLRGQAIAINVLSAKNNDIFKAFARPNKAVHDDRFEGLELAPNDGPPVFANAVAILNCTVTELMDAGDHVIALAQVRSARMINADAEPMVHLRKNGFQY